MATVTITTTSYVSIPDDDSVDPEAIVKEALESADAIYMVEVESTRVLFER